VTYRQAINRLRVLAWTLAEVREDLALDIEAIGIVEQTLGALPEHQPAALSEEEKS
jgi:hypothetical protein